MSPHSLHNNNNNNNATTILTINSTSSSSSFREKPERNSPSATSSSSSSSYSSTCCYNGFKLNPPFDSAMALTVLVLLTALFFMGFLSIYIRRFADQNSLDPSRFRRFRRTARGVEGEGEKVKGADPTIVGSLPAYVYKSGDVEEGVEKECAICLGGFEEKESVKEIPYCGHVFHAVCIDTWLLDHVTCPLCRTSEFFPRFIEKGSDVTEM